MSESESFDRVNQLLKLGHLRDAYHEIEKLEIMAGISDESKLSYQILKSNLLMKMGNLYEALDLSEYLLQESKKRNNQLQIIDVIILKVEILWRLGRYSESLEMTKKGEELQTTKTGVLTSQIREREALLVFHKGINLFAKGNPELGLECVQRSLATFEELDKKQYLGESFNILGVLSLSNGELDWALDCFQKSLAIFEKLGNKRGIAIPHANMGKIFQIRGDLERALEHTEKASRILKEIGDNKNFAESLGKIGSILLQKGELDQALTYTEKASHILEEIGAQQDFAECLVSIGDIYRYKGEIEKAQDYYQNSMAIFEEMGIKVILTAYSLSNLGRIFHAKGEFELALDYFIKSLNLSRDIGYDLFIAGVLYSLIKLSIDTNNLKAAKSYLIDFQEINDKEDNKLINQGFRIAQAILLKTSNRVIKRAEAQRILQQVAEEEIIYFESTVDAILNLCDLLLDELRSSGSEEALNEVNVWSNKLLEIAKNQQSFSLLSETKLLQSRLALLELNVDRAQELLNQVLALTEERGLKNLAIRVKKEQVSLNNQIIKWLKFIELDEKPSMKEMIDMTHIDKLIERMLQVRLYYKEEDIFRYVVRAQQLIETLGKD